MRTLTPHFKLLGAVLVGASFLWVFSSTIFTGVFSAYATTTASSIPNAPSGLAVSGSLSSSMIPLTWNDNSDNEDKFNIERKQTIDTTWSGTFFMQLSANTQSYYDTAVSPGTAYDYRVQACLSGYGCSGYVYLIGVTTMSEGDTTPPAPPSVLYVNSISSGSIGLSWSPASDNIAVTTYKVFRNSTFITSVTGTNYTDFGLASGTTYAYYVKSADAAGNESAPSITVSTTTPSGAPSAPTDTNPPTTPTSLVIYYLSPTEVKLSWAASTDNAGVAGYKIYRGGTPMVEIGTASNLNYTDTTMTPGTGYYYSVVAYDAANNLSSHSANVFVNVPTASTKPNPPVLYGSSTANSAILSWTESTAGVSGFKLYRIVGSTVTDIGNRTSPYTDSGLSAGTYSYKVQAFVDGGTAGPVYSDPSNIVTVTVGESDPSSVDTAPPTPPTLTATLISPTQVYLSYAGASDNVGVVGYRIYRNSTSLNSSLITGQSYTDSTVSPGTAYSYFVKVFDAANNYGTSISVNVTIPNTVASTTSGTDTTPPVVTQVYTSGVVATGARVTWSTDDASDSRVLFGTISRTNSSYPLQSTARCDSATFVTFHCVDLSTLTLGTRYYFRVVSQNSSGLEAISPEFSFITTTLASTATATTTTTTAVTVSALRGASYCEGGVAKTPLTFSVSPFGGAFFRFATISSSTTIKNMNPGTYLLQNGVYRWDALAYSGYTLSGKANEEFELSYVCANVATTTTAQHAYIELIGPAVMHIQKGASYIEPGARGYLTIGGSAVAPKIDKSALNVSVPGSYKVTYRLLDQGGFTLASNVRTVVVDAPILSTTIATTTSTEPMPALSSLAVDPLPTPYTALPVATVPASVETIQSPEQSALFCDNPLHRELCRTYVVEKIGEVRPATPPPVVTLVAFNAMRTDETVLPAGANSPRELSYACMQAQYALKCAELFVASGMADKESADRAASQTLAMHAEKEQMIADRVGARMFVDTDRDEIADYDEVNIYHTDPNNADSNGDGETDGAEILLGTDPSARPAPISPTPKSDASSTMLLVEGSGAEKNTDTKITYEDPNFAGDVKPELLAVTDVTSVATEVSLEGTTTTKVRLSGKALPNSFVTLFIYSDPIVVTVKTNESGDWVYTLTKDLPDGSHKVLSAITDSGGRILAKSDPLPFVKVASAVSFGAGDLLPAAQQAPGFFTGISPYVLGTILVVVLGGAVLLVGFMTRRTATTGLSDVVDLNERK